MEFPTFTQPAADLAPAQTVAQWPESTFLENLAFAPDGSLYVTEYVGAAIHRLDGDWRAERLPDPGFLPMGIAFASDGTAVLSGQRTPGFERRPGDQPDGFWHLDTATGATTHIADAPGAVFLNGLTPRGGDRFLCAESIGGNVWQVDLAAGKAVVACNHDLLAPADPSLPFPAANGIKVREGFAYVSNWAKKTILRAALTDGGLGEPEVWADDVIVDDFAFAADGALFGATHLETVVRLDPDGGRATVADAGAGIAGCTAPAFGPDGQLYVITDGGSVSGNAEPARLVRLAVGRAGQALL